MQKKKKDISADGLYKNSYYYFSTLTETDIYELARKLKIGNLSENGEKHIDYSIIKKLGMSLLESILYISRRCAEGKLTREIPKIVEKANEIANEKTL